MWSGGSNLCATTGWGTPVYQYTPGSDAYTDTDDPTYDASHKFKWIRDPDEPFSVDEDYPRDADNYWNRRVVKDDLFWYGLGAPSQIGHTGYPASFTNPYAQISYKSPNGQLSTHDGLEPSSRSVGSDYYERSKISEDDPGSYSDQYDNTNENRTFWYLFTNPTTGVLEITIWCEGEYMGNVVGPNSNVPDANGNYGPMGDALRFLSTM